MNYTAEYGIAAHWKYKEGIKGKDKLEDRLAWIRQIIEAQQETDDVEEIVRTIKSDLAPEDIFAFTPKGDIITLPAGATIIDFAYAIHTQVGNRMKGAKVDGKLVSLDYQLQTGEIVEILTSQAPDHGPNRAWLDICKTNEAKSKIRSWFKKERREENIAKGKEDLEHEFKRNGINVPPEDMEKFLADDMKRHNCATLDVVSYDNISLLANVTAVTAEMRIPVSELTTKMLKNGNANLIMTCSIAGVQQLNMLISKLRKVQDVISVERIVN